MSYRRYPSGDRINVDFGGGAFPMLLGLLFVGLKLTHYISWPWLWVLSPFWIPVALWLCFGAIFICLYLMANKK